METSPSAASGTVQTSSDAIVRSEIGCLAAGLLIIVTVSLWILLPKGHIPAFGMWPAVMGLVVAGLYFIGGMLYMIHVASTKHTLAEDGITKASLVMRTPHHLSFDDVSRVVTVRRNFWVYALCIPKSGTRRGMMGVSCTYWEDNRRVLDFVRLLAATPLADRLDIATKTLLELYERGRSGRQDQGRSSASPREALEALAEGRLWRAAHVLRKHAKKTGKISDDLIRLEYVLQYVSTKTCERALEQDRYNLTARYYLANTYMVAFDADWPFPQPVLVNPVKLRTLREAREIWLSLLGEPAYEEEAKREVQRLDRMIEEMERARS